MLSAPCGEQDEQSPHTVRSLLSVYLATKRMAMLLNGPESRAEFEHILQKELSRKISEKIPEEQ